MDRPDLHDDGAPAERPRSVSVAVALQAASFLLLSANLAAAQEWAGPGAYVLSLALCLAVGALCLSGLWRRRNWVRLLTILYDGLLCLSASYVLVFMLLRARLFAPLPMHEGTATVISCAAQILLAVAVMVILRRAGVRRWYKRRPAQMAD